MGFIKKTFKIIIIKSSIRFIFQKLGNLSRAKWYSSIMLNVIKRVDFIILERNIKVILITESASESFSLWFGFYHYVLTRNVSHLAKIVRYSKCSGNLTLGKERL